MFSLLPAAEMFVKGGFSSGLLAKRLELPDEIHVDAQNRLILPARLRRSGSATTNALLGGLRRT
jgi:hypothetical protein